MTFCKYTEYVKHSNLEVKGLRIPMLGTHSASVKALEKCIQHILLFVGLITTLIIK